MGVLCYYGEEAGECRLIRHGRIHFEKALDMC